jgi:hypothetical protein
MDSVPRLPVVPRNALKHCSDLPAIGYKLRFTIQIIMGEERLVEDDIFRVKILGRLETPAAELSQKLFDLDEADETIAAGDVPHSLGLAFPAQNTMPRQRYVITRTGSL